MDWDTIERVSGLLATIAVVVSVVYLAAEIRQGTRATHSQTYQAATLSLAEMAGIVAGNRDLSRIYAEGQHDPDSLTKEEYYQFVYLGLSRFRRYENIYFQYENGLIGEEFWQGHRENLVYFFHQPGFQKFWSERRLGFSRGMREFLESTDSNSLLSADTRTL